MSTLLGFSEFVTETMGSGLIDTITSALGMILYPLFSIIFVVISGVQSIFYSFAGIGNASFDGKPITNGSTANGKVSGGEDNTGLIYHLLTRPLVKNLLLSIMVLCLFLIIIFTVMAFIKNAYSAKPKGWKDIIANSIKGLANFVLLPVCCLLGIWLGNILLQAINGATSGPGGTTDMSRKLFIAAAYNANEFRDGDQNAKVKPTDGDYEDLMKLKNYTWDLRYLDTGEKYDFGKIEENQTRAYYAAIVDEIYASTNISIYEWGSVGLCYTLFEVNYIVLIVGGIFMLYVLGALSVAMVRRMFLLVVLFVVSPAVCALYPLDEGKQVGTWKSKVIEQVLSAYGSVAGLNIFFAILPLVEKIQFLTEWAYGINQILQLFIMITGLVVVKDIISLITGFVGGEDAYAKGSGMIKTAKDKALTHGHTAVKAASAFAPHLMAPVKGVFNLSKVGAGAIADRVRNHRAEKAREKEKERSRANMERLKQMTPEERALLKKTKMDNMNARRKAQEIMEESARKRQEAAAAKQAEKQRRAENIRKTKEHFGIVSRGEQAKNILKSTGAGLMSAWDTFYEETKLKKTIESFKADIDGALDRREARDKARADGPEGSDKAKKNLEKVKVNAMSSDVLTAMGDAFGDAVAKKFLSGKMGAQAALYRDRLGLDASSKKSDIQNVDTILKRLDYYSRMIQSSSGKDQMRWAVEAMKYSREADPGGNEAMQNVLAAAHSAYSQVVDTKGAVVKVDLSADAIAGPVIEASKKAGKVMADEFMKNTDGFVEDVQKEKRKGK
ncbi:MAG: hypothetical protein J6Q13_01895 [Clostridia bacterium]|nr:hypothetical protein [Clostridia bacterium]